MTTHPVKRWTGPREDEIDHLGRLRVLVSPERWPYGPPAMHEDHCGLQHGGLWCDCAASDEGDDEYGEGAWPTSPNVA
jgi:hypothetical protein